MIFKRFTVLLIARLLSVGIAMAVVVWMLLQPGLHSATVIATAILVSLVAELWRFVSRTNRELARFLDAARYADYSQRFDFSRDGAGFTALGEAFTDIIERMRARRTGQELELRRLRALIEHIPVPLLTLHFDDAISLQNNAARRLFGAEHVTKLRDLRNFGSSFAESVATAVPGARQLVTFSVEGIEYQLTLATTEIIIAGESERLISLQDIQSELDATQAQAWEELVRVLTHEIMNSITPVTSLAKTSVNLVEDIVRKEKAGEALDEDLEDLRDAVATVARRSDSLTQFVDSYRQISRLAPPEKKRVRLRHLFDSASQLLVAEWPDSKVRLSVEVTPTELDVYADRDLLEPVLLNLLRNAWQSTVNIDSPAIALKGRLNKRNNVVIDVIDNGPGVPDAIATKIFVPFFTTKESGSGVGLALARQVMIAHGGFIRLSRNDSGGATFSLTF
jgi:nitrogen fixation/metabolism regulation signal transduction histidine kinase